MARSETFASDFRVAWSVVLSQMANVEIQARRRGWPLQPAQVGALGLDDGVRGNDVNAPKRRKTLRGQAALG